jgi:hypothetical protein
MTSSKRRCSCDVRNRSFVPKNRLSTPVLEECVRRKIAFVPFAPLGSYASGPNPVLGAPQVVRQAGRLGIGRSASHRPN